MRVARVIRIIKTMRVTVTGMKRFIRIIIRIIIIINKKENNNKNDDTSTNDNDNKINKYKQVE